VANPFPGLSAQSGDRNGRPGGTPLIPFRTHSLNELVWRIAKFEDAVLDQPIPRHVELLCVQPRQSLQHHCILERNIRVILQKFHQQEPVELFFSEPSGSLHISRRQHPNKGGIVAPFSSDVDPMTGQQERRSDCGVIDNYSAI